MERSTTQFRETIPDFIAMQVRRRWMAAIEGLANAGMLAGCSGEASKKPCVVPSTHRTTLLEQTNVHLGTPEMKSFMQWHISADLRLWNLRGPAVQRGMSSSSHRLCSPILRPHSSRF
jgi:hypothetical protein